MQVTMGVNRQLQDVSISQNVRQVQEEIEEHSHPHRPEEEADFKVTRKDTKIAYLHWKFQYLLHFLQTK